MLTSRSLLAAVARRGGVAATQHGGRHSYQRFTVSLPVVPTARRASCFAIVKPLAKLPRQSLALSVRRRLCSSSTKAQADAAEAAAASEEAASEAVLEAEVSAEYMQDVRRRARRLVIVISASLALLVASPLVIVLGRIVDAELPEHVPVQIVGDWVVEDGDGDGNEGKGARLRVSKFNIGTLNGVTGMPSGQGNASGASGAEAATSLFDVKGPAEFTEDSIVVGFSMFPQATVRVTQWPHQE